MQAYLTMTAGHRVGSRYDLAPKTEHRIGRGLDCAVVLTDPQSSRVHAVVYEEDGLWWLRDAGSRNCTFMNGHKVDEVRLTPGSRIRIGSTELTYNEADEPPYCPGDDTQTIVRDAPIDPNDTGQFAVETLQGDKQRAEDFLLLYQLTIKLLGCADPDEVVHTTLELLHARLAAAVVGFLWVSDDDTFKAKMTIPAEGSVNISQTLTNRVLKMRHAVWVNEQGGTTDTSASLSSYSDAICVPLINQDRTLGALHLYREDGGFRQGDFEVATSAANILVVALARAREQTMLKVDHQRLREKSGSCDDLIGDSKPMQSLKSRIQRVAQATGCVLIRGESGAGKELVAAAVHKSSQRADRPMLSVNCAALPRDLMESQLFGHKKGAFTGAESDHTGWFEQADTGTLFLDEVGEMTLEGQAKLLRILEGHPFLPVGGTKEISVDVRVIAATNRDLTEFVRERRFREDLYYRLSVFELVIPPLRDRGTDIDLLIHFFLDSFRRNHGRPSLDLSEGARERLISYNWPGNVRQMRNVIDSAVVMAEGDTIELEDLGIRDVSGGDELESLKIDFWEKKLIKEALSRTGGSVPQAAKLVGIGRATLYRKLEEYGFRR